MTGVSAHRDLLGDEAMARATGRSPDAWFALLDAEGATAWSHSRIAAWLGSEHGVADWWCQSITIRFEQARGMRLPGQQADGTFSAGASRSVALDPQRALALAIEVGSEWLGQQPVRVSAGARHPSARWKLGSETVLAMVSPTRSGTVSVSFTRSGMVDGALVEHAKPELAALLDRLVQAV